MNELTLDYINSEAVRDPAGFVCECDKAYEDRLLQVAEELLSHRNDTKVVLLAGPSGSGKTTTALKLEEILDKRGIGAFTVSLDDYFLTVTDDMPIGEDGKVDLETPLRLDLPLLREHIVSITKYGEAMLPVFDFTKQARKEERKKLKINKDEIVIFEGIHALNNLITGDLFVPTYKMYTGVRRSVFKGEELFFERSTVRFIRRLVRDFKFRGFTAERTTDLWESVRRGDKKYIDPFINDADFVLDTTLLFDIGVLKKYALPLLEEIINKNDFAAECYNKMNEFCDIDDKLIKDSSLLREFIGNSKYYKDN